MSSKAMDETKLAEEIVAAVGEEAVRVCSDDRDSIRFAIRSAVLRLRSVVLGRAALRRLLFDPLRDIKVEYLQRDLQRSAAHRREYTYPRRSALVSVESAERRRVAAR